jgi:hypothetical protein
MSGFTPFLPGWREPAGRPIDRPSRRLKRATVAMPPDIWGWLEKHAAQRRVSRSRALSDLLVGQRARRGSGGFMEMLWLAKSRLIRFFRPSSND